MFPAIFEIYRVLGQGERDSLKPSQESLATYKCDECLFVFGVCAIGMYCQVYSSAFTELGIRSLAI